MLTRTRKYTQSWFWYQFPKVIKFCVDLTKLKYEQTVSFVKRHGWQSKDEKIHTTLMHSKYKASSSKVYVYVTFGLSYVSCFPHLPVTDRQECYRSSHRTLVKKVQVKKCISKNMLTILLTLHKALLPLQASAQLEWIASGTNSGLQEELILPLHRKFTLLKNKVKMPLQGWEI